MTTPTKTTTTEDRLHAAVHQARTARHHQDCHCGNLRVNNAPYCTAQEATATRRVDILLDVLLKEPQPRCPPHPPRTVAASDTNPVSTSNPHHHTIS